MQTGGTAMVGKLLIAILMMPSALLAATGDIIYQNCTDTGACNGAASANGWTRTVETSGCYSGSCLKLEGTWNGTRYGSGGTSLASSGLYGNGHTEITVTYRVKFDQTSTAIDDGNIKQIRPYVGSGGIYYSTHIIPHFGLDFYTSRVVGTIEKATWYDMVTGGDYPTDNGDGTFFSEDGYIRGSITGTTPQPFGTQWSEVRHWIKLPSTPTATDSEMRIWVDGEEMLHIYNAQMKDTPTVAEFTGLTFFPSSEAGEAFEHWMDEMVVYEGYVPPSGPTAHGGRLSGSLSGGGVMR